MTVVVAVFLLFSIWNFKIQPLLFNALSLRLFAAAHVAMLSISCWRVPALTDGMTRYVSSANLTSELPGCNGFRSAAVTVNE